MPKIILCRGIQGSGKTTWAKQWVLEDPEHRVRFNNDDIRNMLGKYMNLNPKEIEFYKPYIEAHNQTVEELRKENILNPQDDFKYELEFKNFFIPLQDCIDRDAKRPNPIGEEVIRKTYEKYKDILKV